MDKSLLRSNLFAEERRKYLLISKNYHPSLIRSKKLILRGPFGRLPARWYLQTMSKYLVFKHLLIFKKILAPYLKLFKT